MKYLFVLLLLIPTQYAVSQTYVNGPEHTLQVQGEAILRIQPDQVVLNLGVDSKDKELMVAKDQNSQIIQKAIAYCKEQGIEDQYIQTGYMSIHPVYNNRNDLNINYYSISQSITILLDDLSKYEDVLTELLNMGINKVTRIHFRTSKMETYRKEVRKMAIDAAKEKAAFLSSEVGLKLGKVIHISETVGDPVNSYSRSNYANTMGSRLSDEYATGTLSAGMLSIKALMRLTYSIKEEE